MFDVSRGEQLLNYYLFYGELSYLSTNLILKFFLLLILEEEGLS